MLFLPFLRRVRSILVPETDAQSAGSVHPPGSASPMSPFRRLARADAILAPDLGWYKGAAGVSVTGEAGDTVASPPWGESRPPLPTQFPFFNAAGEPGEPVRTAAQVVLRQIQGV